MGTSRTAGRNNKRGEFRKAVITSPPSDTIWLNTCSRITFTWWMGWSEWRLDMDHQLILTDRGKFCIAYFILFWKIQFCTGCQVFSTALTLFIYLLKIEVQIGQVCFLLLCACVGNHVLVCVSVISAAQWTVETIMFVLLSTAAFNNYRTFLDL